jgi:hypothetical protein
VFKPGSKNEINPRGAQLQGVRKVAFSRPLDISDLREQLKKKKISLNDFIFVTAQLAMSQIATSIDHV